MHFEVKEFKWTREPEKYLITEEKMEIITKPHTDLWQRTYYHFRNDNAPVLQITTDEKYFSFIVKTEFESKHRFDQCGTDSAAEKMIIVLNVLLTEKTIVKCEFAICGTAKEPFNLVSMHVAQRTHHLKPHLQIWK